MIRNPYTGLQHLAENLPRIVEVILRAKKNLNLKNLKLRYILWVSVHIILVIQYITFAYHMYLRKNMISMHKFIVQIQKCFCALIS